jgi:hypothetical protein
VAEHLAAHDPSAPELRELEDDLLRVTVLAAVAARLAEPRRTDAFREALLEVRALADAPVRADAIAAVAPFLPKELLHEALAALWGSIDAGILVDALTELSGHLPASQQTRVLASALGTAVATEDDTVASRSLLQLAPLLPDELFGPALDRISAIEYEPARAEAIAALAPLLPDGLVEAARAHARALREDSARVKALMALARRMSDPVEPAADVLETMSDFVRAAEVWRAFDEPDASARARALAELLPGFPDLRPDLLREALDAARTIYDPLDRTETIEAIAAALPDPRTRSLVLQDALAAAFRLGDGEDRTRIVERLASSLQPADVLAIARRIVDPHARARALLDIAPRLGEERAVARAEALTAARRISDEPRRAPMLARVAAHLSHDERDEARREAVRLAVFSRASDRPWMLVDVAPHLPEPRRTRMLDLALRTRPHVLDRSSRAELYARAAAEFRQPKRRESAAATAVAAALGITDDARRAQTLRRLVQRLTRVPEVGLAVRAAMNIRADSLKRDFVVEVAAQLPESALADALVVVESIDHERERAAALVAVARRLPEPLLRDALDLTGTIRLPEARADVLVELAQRLPASWLPWALALAATTEYPAARARSLAALAPRVTEAALEEKALSAARGIDVPRWRAHALVAVAEQLPALQKVEALVEAVAAAPRSDPVREQALVQLGSLLPSLDRAHALTAWSELVRALALQPPADVLADVRPLAPVLAELGGERAVVEAATAIENVARWLP